MLGSGAFKKYFLGMNMKQLRILLYLFLSFELFYRMGRSSSFCTRGKKVSLNGGRLGENDSELVHGLLLRNRKRSIGILTDRKRLSFVWPIDIVSSARTKESIWCETYLILSLITDLSMKVTNRRAGKSFEEKLANHIVLTPRIWQS